MMIAYRNAIILDGTKDMTPIKGKVILVKDGKIQDMVDDKQDLTGYRGVDLKGSYITPGLINMHVHLPADGKPKEKPSNPVKAARLITSNGVMRSIGKRLCASYAKTELESGVTTIRTVGGIADFDTWVRDRIQIGKQKGPRILASNMAVSVPGGHMAGSLAYEAMSKEDMIRYVDEIAKGKPDLIKLMITGGVLDAKVEGEPGMLKMSPEYVKAACDRAHKLGFRVAAHVESAEGVRVALENGVDTIEHGANPDAEIIELFRERQASLIATISPALPFARFDQSVSHVSDMEKVNGNIVFEGIIACAKACLENDIPVGLGTDVGCPYTTHYNMWRELFFFHKYCGVSNQFALYTATLGNAQIAGIDSMTGSIEKGKAADFIVMKHNPLENLQALRTIEMVVAQGKMIRQPKVKKMEQVERELDKFL